VVREARAELRDREARRRVLGFAESDALRLRVDEEQRVARENAGAELALARAVGPEGDDERAFFYGLEDRFRRGRAPGSGNR